MTKHNPIYGQGSNESEKHETGSSDPWHERYKYGSHYRRGPKNTDYRAIPPQSRLEIYDSQIGQLNGAGHRSNLDDRSFRSVSGGAEKNYSGRGPRGYKRGDDKIWEDVCDALANAYDVDASEMEVNVDNSEVTLHGVVKSREEAWRAEQIAWDIPGVEKVENHVEIKYF